MLFVAAAITSAIRVFCMTLMLDLIGRSGLHPTSAAQMR